MELFGYKIRLGMTWDEMVNFLSTGNRENLERPDEDTWVATYSFRNRTESFVFTFRREGLSPYRLVDLK